MCVPKKLFKPQDVLWVKALSGLELVPTYLIHSASRESEVIYLNTQIYFIQVTFVTSTAFSRNNRVAKSQDTSNVMSTFESLPLEIRRQIYGLLLCGNPCSEESWHVTATAPISLKNSYLDKASTNSNRQS